MLRHRVIATDTLLPYAQSFVLGETQYPATWLDRATPEELVTLGVEIVDIPDPELVVTPAMVDAERDRRTNTGVMFEGTFFQTRPIDRENVAGAVTLASLALMAGAQPGDLLWHGGLEPFVWIAGDNSVVTLDAHQMVGFGRAVAAHKSAHIFAARALKDQVPIPIDYTSDAHWPTTAT